ncbi:MAG: hypothetical protein EOO40_06595 [Deltaproteobacteria bacterium]|nr:MAG: hypothetical protein EOO40_06595 [Deltaproteobacteria bacterium]
MAAAGSAFERSVYDAEQLAYKIGEPTLLLVLKMW